MRETQSKKSERGVERSSPPDRYHIPPRSKKRLKQEETYHKLTKEMDEQKDIYCFFCGTKMNRPEDHHHLAGRDNEMIFDRKLLVHAHRKCHVAYHNKPVDQIPWFDSYLNRLSDIDPDLAYRESLRRDKS